MHMQYMLILTYRVQISSGILMAMTSLSHMGLLYMGVQMGKSTLKLLIVQKVITITISDFHEVMWVKAASTNNNPVVILLYYLTSILTCKGINKHCTRQFCCSLSTGVPSITRSDCGTENSSLAACHMMLRHGHGDEFREKSYRYGSSTTNLYAHHSANSLACIAICKQRIEGWWAQLRNFVTDYWINIFKVSFYSYRQ